MRASPFARDASQSSAGFGSFTFERLRIFRISSSVRDLSTKTRQRERSAEFTSKLGFSVVAPMSVRRPDSTNGRR